MKPSKMESHYPRLNSSYPNRLTLNYKNDLDLSTNDLDL